MFVIWFAGMLVVLSVILCLGQVIDPRGFHQTLRQGRPFRWPAWQIAAWIAVAIFLLYAAAEWRHGGAAPFTLLALILGAGFVLAWQREFVFLMSLRDDDLPGRHDKVIWAVLLLALAPIGVWFFRAYRLAHWPEAKGEFHGEFGPEPVGTTR